MNDQTFSQFIYNFNKVLTLLNFSNDVHHVILHGARSAFFLFSRACFCIVIFEFLPVEVVG